MISLFKKLILSYFVQSLLIVLFMCIKKITKKWLKKYGLNSRLPICNNSIEERLLITYALEFLCYIHVMTCIIFLRQRWSKLFDSYNTSNNCVVFKIFQNLQF